MKKMIVLAVLITATVFSVVIYGQVFWGGKTMSARQVKAKWGDEKYDSKKFKDSSFEQKAKMSYSIMTDKNLLGKSYEEIREIFGENDGFYFLDTYPAYIIQSGKNRTEETWQIVFRMGNQRKVRDIIMHKNCCEN